MKFFRWIFGHHTEVQNAETSQEYEVVSPSIEHSDDHRRRRNDIPYLLPKDIEEGSRLNLQHYLLRYAIKSNFLAPIEEPVQHILDVGSGTGIWGQEVARQFPSARIFGLDLEPPQSLTLSASVALAPPNYHFVEGNVLQGLPFPDQTFHFTHQRMLVLAIPSQEWPSVIREMIRVTRVGGWVELLELGGTMYHAGPNTERMLEMANTFLLRRGFDLHIAERLSILLKQAGLRQVEHHIIDVPIGSWDTHLGTLLEKDIISSFAAIKAGICTQLQIAPEEYDRLLAALPAEWKKHRTHHRFHLAYGRV